MNKHAWLEQLATQTITTPSYIYSVDEMTRQLNVAKEALGTDLLVTVAACPNPDILGRLPTGTCVGALSATKAEMSIVSAWKTDYSFVKISALDQVAARAVLGGKYLMIVDQSKHIETLAQVRGKRAVTPLSLCINTGQFAPFDRSNVPPELRPGMDGPDLMRAIELAKQHEIPVGGIEIHIGPAQFAKNPIGIADKLVEIVESMERMLGYPLQTMVLDPALGNTWEPHKLEEPLANYRKHLETVPRHIRLLHSIGRPVLASAGAFACKVIGLKNFVGQAVAVCDGGLPQAMLLTKAAGQMRLKGPIWIKRGTELIKAKRVHRGGTWLQGPTGLAHDVLGRIDISPEAGDIILFADSGAYVQGYSPNQFLGFGAVPALIV